MSELSRLAQTLLDYATSGAKRNWSDVVRLEHLLVAIRRWDSDWFDREYPKLAASLESLLAKNQGDSLKPESVDSTVREHLKTINRSEDVPILAAAVVEALKERLHEPRELTEDKEATPQARAHCEQADSIKEVEEVPQAGKPLAEGALLQLNSALATRIAISLARDVEPVKNQLSSHGHAVVRRVLGEANQQASVAINESLGVSGTMETVHDYLQLVRELLADSSPGASRTATQLSLAYVDVAEFAASLDANVTDSEIRVINEIRLETRELLGERIDATSDAVLEFEQQFGELVGMTSVKEELRKRIEYMLVNQRRARRGFAASAHRMHMAFVGNPGTGKTTVARLFGQMLKKLGLLTSDVFVETDRAGLVGEYIGHTEKKTRAVVRRADGGMLFVDEAYALNDRYSDDRKGFGEEAVDVLVKEMEDRRESLAIIFAGYTNRMNDFLEINPGLKSRIPSVVEFPDYSNDDLVEIAHRIAKRRGLTIDFHAAQRMREVLGASRGHSGFGNAREVENMMDMAQRNLIERLSYLGNLATNEEANRILSDDIPMPAVEDPKRQVGFGRYI
jgi:stage V sporulation protein K